MIKFLLVIAVLLLLSAQAQAKAIPFEDFIFLERGMSEGEILLRVGPPDHEVIINNIFVYRKIWYYIPDGNYSGDRLTEIRFGPFGRVISIERTHPLQRGGSDSFHRFF